MTERSERLRGCEKSSSVSEERVSDWQDIEFGMFPQAKRWFRVPHLTLIAAACEACSAELVEIYPMASSVDTHQVMFLF